jgi:hypothetical protein
MKTTLHFTKATLLAAALTLCVAINVFAQAKLPYENNFEKAEVGKVPEDMLVLDGQFTVKEESENKVLELPGDPLDSFGVLFGPTETSNIVVTAKIFGTGKGRRFPTFGIGANGVNGYRLQVSPGKKLVELYKRDEVVKSVAYEFKSGAWTNLKLQISLVKEGEIKIEGKAWTKDTDEPKEPLVSYTDNSPASAGRASIWGSPYSGTPIQFDDLSVTQVETK